MSEHYVGLSCSLWQLKEWFRSCKGQQRLFKPNFLGFGKLQGGTDGPWQGEAQVWVSTNKGQINMMEIADIG